MVEREIKTSVALGIEYSDLHISRTSGLSSLRLSLVFSKTNAAGSPNRPFVSCLSGIDAIYAVRRTKSGLLCRDPEIFLSSILLAQPVAKTVADIDIQNRRRRQHRG
jgi:hypothetical protein